jgi:hypothetical protein
VDRRKRKDLADEADSQHGRSRLDPAIKDEIEERLISGESVAVIVEKVDVSAPTVYVIRSRLKKEGKLD